MKRKVTVDGKVYEVEVEVAPEPPQTLPTFLVGVGQHVRGGSAQWGCSSDERRRSG